jgi:hypothetical protein
MSMGTGTDRSNRRGVDQSSPITKNPTIRVVYFVVATVKVCEDLRQAIVHFTLVAIMVVVLNE